MTKEEIQQAAERLAAVIRTAATIAASDDFGEGWCESITVPRIFCDGKVPETYHSCICPTRNKEAGELVRMDWNQFGSSSDLSEFSDLLRLAIGPFIEGVGHVVTDDATEGGVVIRRDVGKACLTASAHASPQKLPP